MWDTVYNKIPNICTKQDLGSSNQINCCLEFIHSMVPNQPYIPTIIIIMFALRAKIEFASNITERR